MLAETVAIVFVDEFCELCEPLLLFILLLHQSGISLCACFPSNVKCAPVLIAIILYYRFFQCKVGIGEFELTTVFRVFYLVKISRANLFQCTLAISDTLLPKVVGQLTCSLNGIVVGDVLVDFGLWIFHTHHSKRQELAAASLLTAQIVFRTGTIVLTSHKARHLSILVCSNNNYLEYEVCNSLWQFSAEVKVLALLVYVCIHITCLERLLVLQQTLHLLCEDVFLARNVKRSVFANADCVKL